MASTVLKQPMTSAVAIDLHHHACRDVIAAKARAIVFDMDGVLVDSSSFHREAFMQVLAPLGIAGFDYSRFAGWRTADVFRAVISENGRDVPDQVIQTLAEAKSRMAREKLARALPIAPGCTESLGRLAKRFRLAIATSGSQASVELFLSVTGTRRLFDSVLTGEDVRFAKPDPEIYLRSFAAVGEPSSACVVVEDALAGVRAGKAAGATVVAMAGTCDARDLLGAGADHTVHKLSELVDLFCP